jgi:hypothetical protein
MFSFAAVDAGKAVMNASKAISTRLPQEPQTERKKLLVCAVEGKWQTQIERTVSLLKDGPGESGTAACGDSEANQRQSREPGQNNVDVREFLRTGVPTGLSATVESIDSRD